MICPKCGHEWKWCKSGWAKNPRKGFGTPSVLAAAIAARRLKAQQRQQQAQGDTSTGSSNHADVAQEHLDP